MNQTTENLGFHTTLVEAKVRLDKKIQDLKYKIRLLDRNIYLNIEDIIPYEYDVEMPWQDKVMYIIQHVGPGTVEDFVNVCLNRFEPELELAELNNNISTAVSVLFSNHMICMEKRAEQLHYFLYHDPNHLNDVLTLSGSESTIVIDDKTGPTIKGIRICDVINMQYSSNIDTRMKIVIALAHLGSSTKKEIKQFILDREPKRNDYDLTYALSALVGHQVVKKTKMDKSREHKYSLIVSNNFSFMNDFGVREQ